MPMDEKERVRQKVWDQLEAVARPDSRFHWDFNRFIPDFEGSLDCADRIRQMTAYQDAGSLLITPDNSLAAFRAGCIRDGKRMIVPTYGLARGFLQLEREDVPPGQEAYAASLDGLDAFGRPYPLARKDRQAGPGPGLLVTGASVLNQDGVRISRGPSFFDLEWLILLSLGLIDEHTPVITVVHDCQLVNLDCAPLPYGIVTDLIVTPTTVITPGSRYPRPSLSAISSLPWQILQDVPILQELAE